MFVKTHDLLNVGYNPTVITNRAHEYLKGDTYGLAYERKLDYITAIFSGGYYSSSTGKTHYGNSHKWAICGTPSSIHYVRGKEVTCKNCLRLFGRAFPVNIDYTPHMTQAIPIIATNTARVKYSQRGFFDKVKAQAYRKNTGKWMVSRIHEGRPENYYEGQPLRVLLSPPSRLRELKPMGTYYIPDSYKDVGVTVVSFEQEVSVKGRILIMPSSMCFATIKNSCRWLTMPFDRWSVKHIRRLTTKKGGQAIQSLLNDWILYMSYQETIGMVLVGEIKPVKGHKLATP